MTKKIFVILSFSIALVLAFVLPAYADSYITIPLLQGNTKTDFFNLQDSNGNTLFRIFTNGTVKAVAGQNIITGKSLIIPNPANTYAYTLNGGAITANRTLSLPAITGTDTLAALGLSQTFTGANTFNADQTIQATNKLFFDGGSTPDTYIKESSPDVMSFYVNNTNVMRIAKNSVQVTPVFDSSPTFQVLEPVSTGQTVEIRIGNSGGNGNSFDVDYIHDTNSMNRKLCLSPVGDFISCLGFWANANDDIVLHGGGTIGQNASSGFVWIPANSGGKPGGTPDSLSVGAVPLSYDVVDDKICVYHSGWKCVALN